MLNCIIITFISFNKIKKYKRGFNHIYFLLSFNYNFFALKIYLKNIIKNVMGRLLSRFCDNFPFVSYLFILDSGHFRRINQDNVDEMKVKKNRNMEAKPVMHSRCARSKRKKKRQLKKTFQFQSSSPENFNFIHHFIKRKENESVKYIQSDYFSPLCKSSCVPRVSVNSSQDNPLEETIDLVDCDDTIDFSNSSVVMPLPEIKQNEDVIILKNYEIIDLTKPGETSKEPTVIDISEDDLSDQQNPPKENNEIFVLGTYSKHSHIGKKCKIPPVVPLSNKLNCYNDLIKCSDKLRRKYLKKQFVLDKIDNKNVNNLRKHFFEPKKDNEKVADIGRNIYVNSPLSLPSSGLRPIIIDGSNVAFVHSNFNFSCKRLEICINYFKEKGHKVTAFVPQFRLNKCDKPNLLRKLEKQGYVILTPSKKVDGRHIVPYDDRFIVQTAALKGGIIVTRDNYNDLLKENPAWAETIKYRTLAFTWVDDVLMFPSDPLGEYGPKLEEFLRFQ